MDSKNLYTKTDLEGEKQAKERENDNTDIDWEFMELFIEVLLSVLSDLSDN